MHDCLSVSWTLPALLASDVITPLHMRTPAQPFSQQIPQTHQLLFVQENMSGVHDHAGEFSDLG
jgi:hypothetical protein